MYSWSMYSKNKILKECEPLLLGECLCDKTIDHSPDALISVERRDLIDNSS